MGKRITKRGAHIFLTSVICLSTIIILVINALAVMYICFPELKPECMNRISYLTRPEYQDLQNEQLVENNNIIGFNYNYLSSSEKIQAVFIETGLSLIGIAITVWLGITISNSIDSRRIKELEENLHNSEMRFQRIKQDDKSRFLNELILEAPNPIINSFINVFKQMKTSEDDEIPYLLMTEIERLIKSVQELHKKPVIDTASIISRCKEGIERVNDVKKHCSKSTNYPVSKYLNFQLAEFNFYIGYRVSVANMPHHFEKSAELFKKVLQQFAYNVNDESGTRLDDNSKEELAFLCNLIGESYSMIISKKDLLIHDGHISKHRADELGSYAEYYCGKANQLVENSIYRRNYGCALERNRGPISDYEKIKSLYIQALEMDPSNHKCFKVVLSIIDKRINYLLGIKYVHVGNSRTPSLNSVDFRNNYSKLGDVEKEELHSLFGELHTYAEYAKKLHINESIPYQYSCIYYRDMCAVYGKMNMKEKNACIIAAKKYYLLAQRDYKLLALIAPYSDGSNDNAMTEVLRRDLEDLRGLFI